MEPQSSASEAARPVERLRVPVWDWPVRFVHWSVVLLLAALIATGKLGDEWLAWHMRFGQAMLALVLFRIVWGFAGSRNARFHAFLHGPHAIARYVRSLARRVHESHVTHNPLGGWMAVVLLAALLAQASTGLFTNDDVLWEGPLAQRVTKETSDAISTFHRKFWWVIVALSVVHIAAVLSYLALLRENLTQAMLSGRKLLPEGVGDAEHATASTAKALVLLIACAAIVGYVANRL